MKRPTLNSGARWSWLSAWALVATLQAQAQPQRVESPPSVPVLAQAVAPAATRSSPAPTRPRLSPWAKEIVKLTQAGVAQGVVEAFIDNAGVFALGAEQIIYLTDLGVPQNIIQRMLQHDRDLVSGAMPPTIVSEPPYEPLVFTLPENQTGSPRPATATSATVSPPTPAAIASERAKEGVASRPALTAAPSVGTAAPESPPPAPRRGAATPPDALPRRSEPLYPVREPQPVELLPPILFLNAYEPQPNMLVIVGFPKS